MLNDCNFIGNLGRDPETRYSASGLAITNFSVACAEKWKDKNTGEYTEKTEWVNVVTLGKLAEICGEYLHKGKQVFIKGRMQTSSWEKDGVTRYKTEIVASDMKMLGSKSDQREPISAPKKDDDDIPF